MLLTPVGIAAREDPDEEDAVEAAEPVDGHRADGVVDPKLALDPVAHPDDDHPTREREQVRKRRVVDVRAGGDRDDAGKATGERPERVALAGEPPACEPAGEAEGDHHRDRAERGGREVDVQPARERRGLDHEAGGIERVEPGEDQHQPHQRHVGVVGSEASGAAADVVLPDPWPQVEQDAERECACDAVDDAGRDGVVEPEARGEPAARAPAPGGVEDPHHRAEHHGEQQERGEPDPLDEGARHDRGGRPGEQEEGEEEDEADVILEVRAHALAPRCGEAAEAGEGVGGVVAGLRPPLLHAAVDVPAEVVERRRHDGDGEDVLHRRRHDVLASGGACLVRHEADVDQPHEDDGPEVELLGQDLRVELLGVLERLDRLLDGLGNHKDRRQHQAPSSGR